MDKEDLQKAYLDLEKESFPSGKRIKFVANLGSSQEIAYHYELKVETCIQKVALINMEEMDQSFYLNSWMKLKMKNKVY